MTAADHLAALAGRIVAALIDGVAPRAALLAGSAASGDCDEYSDLDLIVYHDRLPAESALAAIRAALGATGSFPLGAPDDEARGEIYTLGGVQCQVGHTTLDRLDRDMATVLVELRVDTPLQKLLSGLLEGVVLHDTGALAPRRARAAAYPEALARAMVAHHLGQIFPAWPHAPVFPRRDAALWRRQLLVETGWHVLGILAGLNRAYFTPFQFKHLRRFAGALAIAPADLAARLDRLADGPPAAAIDEAEALVRDTLALVARHHPDLDLARLTRTLGRRAHPWTPTPDAEPPAPRSTAP